jgi:hypothetical protein
MARVQFDPECNRMDDLGGHKSCVMRIRQLTEGKVVKPA